MAKIVVGYEPKDSETVRVYIRIEDRPVYDIRRYFGNNEDLARNVFGSYRAFLEKYPHLYSNDRMYICDPKEIPRIFNIDYLVDWSHDTVYSYINLVEKGITLDDLKEACREFIDAAEVIYSKYKVKKSLEDLKNVESFKIEKEFE